MPLPLFWIGMRLHRILYIIGERREEVDARDSLHFVYRIDILVSLPVTVCIPDNITNRLGLTAQA